MGKKILRAKPCIFNPAPEVHAVQRGGFSKKPLSPNNGAPKYTGAPRPPRGVVWLSLSVKIIAGAGAPEYMGARWIMARDPLDLHLGI